MVGSGITLPTYFVSYVKIPQGKTPDGIQLMVKYSTSSCSIFCWTDAYWGGQASTPPEGSGWGGTPAYMGPVPAARGQWIQLIIKASDIGLSSGSWYGFGYGAAGGELDWDVTTTQTVASWTDAYLKVSGLPSGVTVGVFYANNGTQIGTGLESGGTANVLLYQKSKGITTFPVMVNTKIYNASNE